MDEWITPDKFTNTEVTEDVTGEKKGGDGKGRKTRQQRRKNDTHSDEKVSVLLLHSEIREVF